MNNIVKVCLKHGDLTADKTHKENNNSKKGYMLRCNQCKLEKDRRWKELNREKHCESSKRWKKNNRERVNQWNREDREKDPGKYKEWARIGRERLGELRTIKEVTRIRGITLDQYYSLVGSQNNKCGICGESETRKNRMGNVARLAIDHCHKTQKVRALLCHGCNTGIGKFKESIELMGKAIEYLKKHNHS